MSITNLGNQVVSLKFHAPATGAEVNKMLRGIIKPGVYSGGVVSIVGGSGTTARIAPFRVVFNSSDGVIDDKLVNIYTTADIDLIHTTTSENILYMTYTYNLSQVVYIDFGWRASTAPAVTNEVILCKVTFTGANMTAVDNGERTVGLFDTTSNLYSSTLIGGAKTTSDIIIQPTTGVGTTGSNVYIKVGNNGSITALAALHTGLIGVGMVNPTRTLDVTGTFGVTGNATLGGTLDVTGILNANGGIGAIYTASTLQVVGNSTFDTNTLFVDAINHRVGIGLINPSYPLHAEKTTTGSNQHIIYAKNTATCSTSAAIYGESTRNYGVRAKATCCYAVCAEASSDTIRSCATACYATRSVADCNYGSYSSAACCYGVFGCAGISHGVSGCSENSYGVSGAASKCYGVCGLAGICYGVYGYASCNYGVYGCTTGSCGIGVYGDANVDNGIGVYGSSVCCNCNGAGVYGVGCNSRGVCGYGAGSFGVGVYGLTDNNFGVYGKASNCYGVYGCAVDNFGVYGKASCYGVYGEASSCYGVYGCAGSARPVAGNGAYCSTSSKYMKYKERVCISECLKQNPLTVYKYIWEDTNQNGWDTFIGPLAQDVYNTFKLTPEDDGLFTVDGIALGLAIELMTRIENLEDMKIQLEKRIKILEDVK